MAVEIERKFLVKSEAFKQDALTSYSIKQGFLNRDPERTVRVRLKRGKGFLTIKGKSTDGGLSRFEWETEINPKDAEALLQRCEKGIIYKTRYELKSGHHIFEVDVFHGENEGLVVAEIELQSADEAFIKPEWLGEEVTGDKRYYNSYLSQYPFKDW
ncbi:CYTH domain-containing protein [Winogradskyella maritima]|uniref:CYTH domain-containing protein n=1 Tax=Winogradskyella maritima TaxID=1517766 RepID=A0ABV8AEQ2_9FLAO|nr:CYTH domain-containing protein [Winogradskyella maritima]